MKNEKQTKKGFLALLREAFGKTGGCCCGPGETCGGPGKASGKQPKDEPKSNIPTSKPDENDCEAFARPAPTCGGNNP